MYTSQECNVRWGFEHSDYSNVATGVKQGGVMSPMLFSCYIDKLFSQLEHSGLGCHVGASYTGAFGYADDIALVALSPQSLRKMIGICEQYAKTYSITLNPYKSKLLCCNVDDIPPKFLYGEMIPSVGSDKHLGNYISTNVADRNIVDSVYYLYQRSTWVISNFRVCDSSTLDSLHQTYCMHMYECELWY